MTEEQLRRMILFVGYGDYKNAKIIFFGNEEGLANDADLPSEIDIRCNHYYNEGICIIPNDPELGFYTIIQNNGEDQYINSPMLLFQSRLMLHFNNHEVDWFQNAIDMPARFLCIKEYQKLLLYKEPQPLIKSALVDLRPLPRPNEGVVWPEEYEILNEHHYFQVFSYVNNINIPED